MLLNSCIVPLIKDGHLRPISRFVNQSDQHRRVWVPQPAAASCFVVVYLSGARHRVSHDLASPEKKGKELKLEYGRSKRYMDTHQSNRFSRLRTYREEGSIETWVWHDARRSAHVSQTTEILLANDDHKKQSTISQYCYIVYYKVSAYPDPLVCNSGASNVLL